MRNRLFFVLFFLATASAVHENSDAQQPTQPRSQESDVAQIMRRYKSFDLDADGTAEINDLSYLDFEVKKHSPDSAQASDKLVLVLVEDRLLNKISGKLPAKDLVKRLKRYKSDLKSDGFESRFILCDVYDGPIHQDGLTLLAIRKFLQDVNRQLNLQGVVIVGSLPESMIVRRWIWKRERWNVRIAGVDYKGANQTPFLRIVPELVAPRADIVLADLDGDWDKIYVKRARELDSIEALPPKGLEDWPKDGMVFESTQFNDNKATFEDFFFVQDDEFQRLDSPAGRLKLQLKTPQRNPELSDSDRGKPNPLAQPEILVSRINARHVAVNPQPTFRDFKGRGFLDRRGNPQRVETKQRINPSKMLERDPAFERRLLIDYFDRNHEFRTKSKPAQNRTAAISYGRGLISASNFNQYLNRSSSTFAEPVAFNNASLLDYLEFMKTPARLKGMSAHSSPWNSSYGKEYELAELEKEIGGTPWRWKEEKVGSGYRYSPSLAQQAGTADSYLHRTIYENELLSQTGGQLFIHNGCEVNTPGNAARVPYHHKDYGTANGFQNAESILFFLNGVALASRSKVFYDKPRGFTDKLGEDPSRCFGDGWRAYFEVESNDGPLSKNVAGNKRTYPWSIIGDWTLRVN